MKAFRGCLTIGIIVILLGSAIIGLVAYQDLYRPVKLQKPQTVLILSRTTFGDVAKSLEKRGLIPSALVFKLYARFTGKARKLRVGEYEITNGQRPLDMLDMLVAGRVKMYRLTIPEGKWASEIEKILTAQGPDGQEFNTLVADAASWRDKVKFPLTGETLEGFLFPDTYMLPRGITTKQVVLAMLMDFERTCWKEYQAHPPTDKRSLYQVLTLASLVEAEAKKPEERPIIAGVYMNRLRKGMKLQCDATVLYAYQQRLARVLNQNLTIDSPYNTYQNYGLPVGPICNPGLASFKAALHPQKVPYLYYVARGDGSHIFTQSLAEHQAAIAQIRGN